MSTPPHGHNRRRAFDEALQGSAPRVAVGRVHPGGGAVGVVLSAQAISLGERGGGRVQIKAMHLEREFSMNINSMFTLERIPNEHQFYVPFPE